MLSFLERASPLWTSDVEAARESLSASISLLLRLIGRDPDPTRSRDHVVLSVFAERRLRAGRPADVTSLLEDVRSPPVETMGAMPVDEFLPKRDRTSLATALNTLLASPTFEAWRTGSDLDVAAWVAPRQDGRTPAVIVSVAHLDDEHRMLTGEELIVSFRGPRSEHWFDCQATVARVVHGRRPGDRGRCLGLRFEGLTPGRKAVLGRLLRGLPPAEPARAWALSSFAGRALMAQA